MISDILRLTDLREQRIDDNLGEPDLAEHPEDQNGPEQEKKLRRLHWRYLKEFESCHEFRSARTR